MFGAAPGEEQRQGIMNQYMVTAAKAPTRVYWIFHTKAENPISVLIAALTKQKVSSEDLTKLIVPIADLNTLPTLAAYERVKDNTVLVWGTGHKEATLDSLLVKATMSCVLAFENVEPDRE